MWNTLATAIQTLVRTSSYVNDADVFIYPETKFDSYPAITIHSADNTNTRFNDTARNERTYVFSIRCFQERTKKSKADVESILRTLVDDLITIFDADPYLGATLQGRGFAKPIPSSWNFIETEQIDVRVAEILIECVVIQ